MKYCHLTWNWKSVSYSSSKLHHQLSFHSSVTWDLLQLLYAWEGHGLDSVSTIFCPNAQSYLHTFLSKDLFSSDFSLFANGQRLNRPQNSLKSHLKYGHTFNRQTHLRAPLRSLSTPTCSLGVTSSTQSAVSVEDRMPSIPWITNTGSHFCLWTQTWRRFSEWKNTASVQCLWGEWGWNDGCLPPACVWWVFVLISA